MGHFNTLSFVEVVGPLPLSSLERVLIRLISIGPWYCNILKKRNDERDEQRETKDKTNDEDERRTTRRRMNDEREDE